jgi:hypothetical protein
MANLYWWERSLIAKSLGAEKELFAVCDGSHDNRSSLTLWERSPIANL